MYKSSSSSHCRKDSEELDVFEAAQYFSGTNDHPNSFNPKAQEFSQPHITRERRMSLDISTMKPPHNKASSIDHCHREQRKLKDQTKKFNQPSSPGGKLASFLNALFKQTSKKTKPKSVISSMNIKENENPSGRRKTRSSISHLIVTSAINTATSGFRTPPPHSETPTKSYKVYRDFTQGYSNKKKVKNELIYAEKRDSEDYEWLQDDHRKFRSENSCKNVGFLDRNSDTIQFDNEAESDSSSDLFDLPNHAMDFYPSGLPVYETTHVGRIKIGPPIWDTAATS